MTNPSIDATIEHVLARLRQMPATLDAALKPIEEKIRQIHHELDAAHVLADTIINSTTSKARDLQKKTEALTATVNAAARSIVNG